MKNRIFIILLFMMTAGCVKKNTEMDIALAGLKGPSVKTVFPEAEKSDWKKYSREGGNSLAVYLTDPESSWLGIVHAFKSAGMPFFITDDLDRALKHNVVVFYPYVSGKVMTEEQMKSTAQFVSGGGTVISFPVLGGGLDDVFGFHGINDSVRHYMLDMKQVNSLSGIFRYEEDRHVRFGSEKNPEETMGSVSYLNVKGSVLFEYEDGSPAVISMEYGSGKSFAFGLDAGFLFQKAFNGRTDGLVEKYVNTYAPGIDILIRFIREIYMENEPAAVVISSAPLDYSLSVFFTHDVDYSESYINSPEYSDLEKQNGIKGTYFIQTKYISDYQDFGLLNSETVKAVKSIFESGMEIASHSVSHSNTFNRFETGSGREVFPSYQPVIINENRTENGTVSGELRVSRFLLESFIGEGNVKGFRPGFLRNPYVLPQLLQAEGYSYSSSVTANSSLTHLPFRLNYGRGYDAETLIYEFPITIEDEEKPEMTSRLDSALSIAEKISAYDGIFNVLIHPNILGHKFGFEKQFLEKTSGKYWFGTLSDFCRWWSARDMVHVESVISENGLEIRLSSDEEFYDLGLILPAGYEIDSGKSPEAGHSNGKAVIKGPFRNYALHLKKKN